MADLTEQNQIIRQAASLPTHLDKPTGGHVSTLALHRHLRAVVERAADGLDIWTDANGAVKDTDMAEWYGDQLDLYTDATGNTIQEEMFDLCALVAMEHEAEFWAVTARYNPEWDKED